MEEPVHRIIDQLITTCNYERIKDDLLYGTELIGSLSLFQIERR